MARLVPAKGPHALKGKLTGVAMTAADEELFSIGATWDLCLQRFGLTPAIAATAPPPPSSQARHRLVARPEEFRE